MTKEPRKSALVEYVMPGAIEEEKAAASARWFAFLRILMRMVDEQEQTERRAKVEAL